MAHSAHKAELIAALDRARSTLAAHTQALRADLDPALRLQRTYRRHPLSWLGGATLLGLLLSRLPARTRPPRAPVARQPLPIALSLGALKFAFTLTRPLITSWLRSRLQP